MPIHNWTRVDAGIFHHFHLEWIGDLSRVFNGGLLPLDYYFPPGPRDPQGIHKAIWDEFIENEFALPPDKPLTVTAYIGGPFPEAFIEPVEVGSSLVVMPLFLTPEVYIPLPLEATYHSAWEAVPSFWRDVLSAPGPA